MSVIKDDLHLWAINKAGKTQRRHGQVCYVTRDRSAVSGSRLDESQCVTLGGRYTTVEALVGVFMILSFLDIRTN